MLSKRANMLLRNLVKRTAWNCRNVTSSSMQTERDPARYFFDSEIQNYLSVLTRVDYNKVCRPRMDGERRQPAEYKFMTDEELQDALKEAKLKAQSKLQMPPVVKPRVDPTSPISNDPALQGYTTTKYVFTDISFGIKNRARLIAIREPNGILRHATWEEKDRLNQVYFPLAGREIRMPRMFESEQLLSLLDRKEYEFILDRACIQFEPDDPIYQKVVREVYVRVKINKDFNALRSTRHFGPMVFYYVWNGEMDNLLIDIIQSKRIDEAALLVKLYIKVHPSAEISAEKIEEGNDIALIKRYAELNAVKRGAIHKALQSLAEVQEEERKLEEGIKRAHGIDAEGDRKES